MNDINQNVERSNEERHGFDYPINEIKSIHDVFDCKDIPGEQFVGISRLECLIFINRVLDPHVEPLTFLDMLDDILCQSIANIVGKYTVTNSSEFCEDAIWNSRIDGWDKWRSEWKHISFFGDTSEDGRRMFNISLFGRDGLDGGKSVFEWDQIRWKVHFGGEDAKRFIDDLKQQGVQEL